MSPVLSTAQQPPSAHPLSSVVRSWILLDTGVSATETSAKTIGIKVACVREGTGTGLELSGPLGWPTDTFKPSLGIEG